MVDLSAEMTCPGTLSEKPQNPADFLYLSRSVIQLDPGEWWNQWKSVTVIRIGSWQRQYFLTIVEKR